MALSQETKNEIMAGVLRKLLTLDDSVYVELRENRYELVVDGWIGLTEVEGQVLAEALEVQT